MGVFRAVTGTRARPREVTADADFFEFDGRERAADAVPPFDRGVPDRPARLVAVVTVGNRVVPHSPRFGDTGPFLIRR